MQCQGELNRSKTSRTHALILYIQLFFFKKRCEVPLPSVPCMNYKRALAVEEQAKEEAKERHAKGEVLPKAQVESAEDAKSR